MTVYNTLQEIQFIKGLGTHSEVLRGSVSRAVLLRGYLAGCTLRYYWGALNREEITAFAKKELRKEEGK